MKKPPFEEINSALGRLVLFVTGAISILSVSGCVVPGTGVHDPTIGYNGDFEIVQSGMPVNWNLSRYPIKADEMKVTIDTENSISGNQSLKIIVNEFDSKNRWKPFLFQTREANEGKLYEISFWLRNENSKVLVEIGYEGKYYMFGGPSETEIQDYAAHPRIAKILGEGETGKSEWRHFRYRYTVPEIDGSIRFELKFLQVGTLWIDDVRIGKIE